MTGHAVAASKEGDPMSDEQWWYRLDGRQIGPISWEQLYARAVQGLVRPEDPIWRTGMAQWVPARTFPELFTSGSHVPPPMQAFPPTTTSGKSRVSAALFALLLGSFGAHKFYMGQTGLGILYLVFFWTGIPGIVGLVEGILYLAMSDEEFARRYR